MKDSRRCQLVVNDGVVTICPSDDEYEGTRYSLGKIHLRIHSALVRYCIKKAKGKRWTSTGSATDAFKKFFSAFAREPDFAETLISMAKDAKASRRCKKRKRSRRMSVVN